MSMHHGADHTPQAKNDNSGGAFEQSRPSFWRSRGGWIAIGFLAIAAFLLFSEHRAHALGYLPLLLLLACPLMHLFMHHGRDNHSGHGHSSPSSEAAHSNPTRERRNA
ncbi:DUF2933 domain-containing protein [Bosea sp. F3-2]|uniref:DUF2933 domain-containing protein n=1 Tax=Bosea sp. F3-2 TaxID=2599640 RepID=UPI0011F03665|nr:DUF2933 domain-containing protein [Bosea sp. F3-2]QEL21966.1 DUF2933 domain-containing protein [Bosea sp. F3-2]